MSTFMYMFYIGVIWTPELYFVLSEKNKKYYINNINIIVFYRKARHVIFIIYDNKCTVEYE